MALPQFLNPRNPVLWITGLASTGVVVIGATTYNAFFGPAATLLEEYTVAVEAESLQVQVDASGTIVPRQSVNVSPLEAGRLERLEVEQGMPVQEGQPLAVMKNDDARLRGAQAEARWQQAIANLQEAQSRLNGRNAQFVAQLQRAEARFAEARNRILAEAEATLVRYQQARQRFERYQIPAQAAAVSTNDLEAVSLELREAQADLQQLAPGAVAQLNSGASQAAVAGAIGRNPELRALSADIREAEAVLQEHQSTGQRELDRLQLEVSEAKAQLDEQVLNFQDQLITAPFDGIVTQKYATEGAFVTPTTSGSSATSSAATSIVAIAAGLEVLAKIPEVDISQVQQGQPVEVIADAYPNKTLRGIVRIVAPEAVVEENVTSFEIRIDVDPRSVEGIQLLPGMNVDVTFLGPRLAQTLVVPTVAIVTEEGQTGVMVPDAGNKPVFRPVTLGNTIEDKTQVVQGLQQGERVFIDIPEKYRKDENAGRV